VARQAPHREAVSSGTPSPTAFVLIGLNVKFFRERANEEQNEKTVRNNVHYCNNNNSWLKNERLLKNSKNKNCSAANSNTNNAKEREGRVRC